MDTRRSRSSLAYALAWSLTIVACGDDGSSVSSTGAETTTSSSTGATDATDATGSSSADASSGSVGGSTSEVCMPPTDDISAIGEMCTSEVDCPAGYECMGFSGIVFVTTCGIPCEEDCNCPEPTVCTEMTDKARTWLACAPPAG